MMKRAKEILDDAPEAGPQGVEGHRPPERPQLAAGRVLPEGRPDRGATRRRRRPGARRGHRRRGQLPQPRGDRGRRRRHRALGESFIERIWEIAQRLHAPGRRARHSLRAGRPWPTTPASSAAPPTPRPIPSLGRVCCLIHRRVRHEFASGEPATTWPLTSPGQAGDLARNYYETTFEVEHKADKSPVTIADREAEELIRDRVAAAFPARRLPRRGVRRPAGHERLPLDHRPHRRHQVVHPPHPTLGHARSVWNTRASRSPASRTLPVFGMTYRALRGDGAYLNERRIRVSTSRPWPTRWSVIRASAGSREPAARRTFLELASRTARQRGYGDFYGFVLVAEGPPS